MLLNVSDLAEHLPIEVFDANGIVIRRAITQFDTVTGDVESFVLSSDGEPLMDSQGRLRRRLEKYPPPLMWKSISSEQAKQSIKRYWDFEGR